MRKIYAIIASAFFIGSVLNPQQTIAQSPEKINYQAVIRDASNDLVTGQPIGMQISILQGSANGEAVYVETQTPTTNAYGLVSFEIGTGITSDDFSVIDWANGPYFIKTETDPTGGSDYIITGTSQLLSVPYAKYADESGDSFSGNYTDLTNQPDLGLKLDTSETTTWDKNVTDDFSGSYSDLSDLPANIDTDSTNDFSGNYNDLTNQPDLGLKLDTSETTTWDKDVTDDFSGSYSDLSDLPANIDTDSTNDFSGNYEDLNNQPTTIQHADSADIAKGIILESPNGTTYKLTVDDAGNLNTEEIITSVTDVDGNRYKVVTIGNQIWMAENLRAIHYVDGTPIQKVTDNTAWINLGDNLTDKAYCWYDNDSISYSSTYGALYTYAAATNGDNSGSNVQGVCPDGWHLPSNTEWQELDDYLIANGYNWDGTTSTNKIAKSLAAKSGWVSGFSEGDVGYDQPSNNSTGFSALPGGTRHDADGTFSGAGYYSSWWTSTVYGGNGAYYYTLGYYRPDSYGGEDFKSNGYSVRCIMD